MDLIRRLPKAAFVTTVALLFFGGTVGVVTAAGVEPMPESLQVAEPKQGDWWTYTLHSTEEADDGEVVEDEDVVSLLWEPADQVYDQAGNPHHVQPLRVGPDKFTMYIDQTTKDGVAYAHDYVYGSRGYSGVGGANVFDRRVGLYQDQTSTSNITVIGYEDAPGPCGMFTELQGQEVPLDRPVLIQGGCIGWADTESLHAFTAFEMREVNGVQAVGFEASVGNDTTRLWYTPNIPYPVRLEFIYEIDWSEVFGDDVAEEFAASGSVRAHDIATMDAFVPGEDEWGVPSGVLPEPLDRPGLAPVSHTGPDDSDIDFPFRLSEAFESAQADPTFVEMATFMQQEPDAQIVQAEYWSKANGDFIDHTWDYMLWGEDSYMFVESTRQIAADGSPATNVDSVAGPRDQHSVQNGGIGFFAGLQDLADIPDEAPSVKEAFERFRDTTGEEPNTYGFDYTCWFSCYFDEPDALSVGREVNEFHEGTPVTGDGSSVDTTLHVYRFDAEGRLLSEARMRSETRTETTVLTSEDGHTPQDHSSPEDMPSVHAPLWAVPSPEAAAGVTFVAFLVGLGYWLWPAIKTLPFIGGFSRVRSDRMLENQVRARVYEVVQQQPGIHYQALIRAVGKGGSVIDHHLRKLQLGGYVVIQKGPGFTCIFPKDEVDHRVMVAVPILKTEAASSVLREVVANPGRSVTEVARALGVAKSTASYHVARLRKACLLEDGPKLFPSPDAKRALAYAA